jgi:hypothetical protein
MGGRVPSGPRLVERELNLAQAGSARRPTSIQPPTPLARVYRLLVEIRSSRSSNGTHSPGRTVTNSRRFGLHRKVRRGPGGETRGRFDFRGGRRRRSKTERVRTLPIHSMGVLTLLTILSFGDDLEGPSTFQGGRPGSSTGPPRGLPQVVLVEDRATSEYAAKASRANERSGHRGAGRPGPAAGKARLNGIIPATPADDWGDVGSNPTEPTSVNDSLRPPVLIVASCGFSTLRWARGV